MRTVKHNYKTSIRWIDVLAQSTGGSISKNFTKGNNEMHKGSYFVLSVEEGITAILINKIYKEDVFLQYRNEKSDFVGLYYYLTDLDVDFILNGKSTLVGELNYNLSIVDSNVNMDYSFKKGTRLFAICILFDKNVFTKKSYQLNAKYSVNEIFLNYRRSGLMRMDRIDPESLILINDFRKIAYENPLFDIFFRGLVYGLISNYLKQEADKKTDSPKIWGSDMQLILSSKKLLKNSVEAPFPGIKYLAKQVSMSPSKFKKLFIEITGLNPGTYFYNIKLNKAKEMLETGKYTVNEVARQLNYSTVSYLGKRFSEKYGICPKKYQSLF